MEAGRRNNKEMVELLLNIPGIDINSKNKFGDTALDIAKNQGYTTIKALIEAHISK